MKKLIKSDPITAAARTQIGVIPVFALCSVGVLAGITLFLMLLTDWSFAMPYYHLDSTAKLAAFEAGRGKSGLMASDGLETWGAVSYTHLRRRTPTSPARTPETA